MVLLITGATALFGQLGLPLLFVFVAAVCGQSLVGWLNDYLDSNDDIVLARNNKPAVHDQLDVSKLKTPMFVVAVLVIPFSYLASGWAGGSAHLFAVIQGLIYDRYLSRTKWSWVPYALAFAALPIFVAQAVSPTLWPSWQIVLAASIIGVIAHLFNALPDISLDEKLSHSGFAVHLGAARSRWLLGVLMVVVAPLLTSALIAMLR